MAQAVENRIQRVRLLFRMEEKQATRALYERIFEDTRAYTDYYYREKCRDNVIAVKEEGAFAAANSPSTEACGRVATVKEEGAGPGRTGRTLLAMAHVNPYLFSVCGLPVRTAMIAAVATVPEHRREGHMRDVLAASFDWLAEQGVPFCILLPVDPAIYRPFGFETVCAFTEREPEQPADYYDIYCIRDLAARDRRAAEQAAEAAAREAGEEDGGWPADPVIMARVTDAAAFDRMAGQAFDSDRARLAWLRGKRICVSDGV